MRVAPRRRQRRGFSAQVAELGTRGILGRGARQLANADPVSNLPDMPVMPVIVIVLVVVIVIVTVVVAGVAILLAMCG